MPRVPRSMLRLRPPRLPVEVEAERERVQVPEDAEGHAADRALAHLREDGVAQLPEGEREDAHDAVADDERDGQDHDGRVLTAERVDRAAVEHGHVDVRGLRRSQEEKREDDARAQAPVARWPEIRKERAQRRPLQPALLALLLVTRHRAPVVLLAARNRNRRFRWVVR